jgi:hypothetical protein
MVRGHGNACRESVNMFPLDVVTLAQMRKSGCIRQCSSYGIDIKKVYYSFF